MSLLPTLPDTPRRALRQALCLALLALISVVSLYPLSGWRDTGAHPLAFLAAGWPRYWTWFDVLSNVLAYALLGGLITLSLRHRVAGAGLWAVVLGALLSLSLEAVQTYLPSRVPSLLDWLANTGGALLGAGLARGVPQRATLRRLGWQRGVPGAAWYEQGPPSGWVLVLLWLASQALPQRMALATGRLEPVWNGLLAGTLGLPPTNLSAGWGGVMPAGLGVSLEAGVVVCAVLGVGSVILTLVREPAARGWVLAGVAAAAIALRSVATQKVYGSHALLAWLTPGAQGGLVMGAVLLYAMASLGPRSRAWCAALAIAVGTLLIHLSPEEAYFQSTAADIQWGPLLHLRGLLELISSIWPWWAVVWLVRHARPAAPSTRAAPSPF